MNNINFANPLLLLILIPLLAIVIVSFVISVNKDNRTVNNVISFICHIIISILLTLSIAKTTLETVITETNIYVLADVSYSANQNLDLIDEYIENLKETAPKNSKLGVICFGKDYQLLVEPGQELVSVKTSTVNNSETNIYQALEYASQLFKSDVIKRIVIISDGKETNDSNVISLVQQLSDENIYIDAVYLDNNIKPDVHEVQINQIEYLDFAYMNTEQNVNIFIQSNLDTKAVLSLYCNNELYLERALTLDKGYNTITLPLKTEEAGTFKYEVKISIESDLNEFNNSYIFNQEIAEKLKVLFLSGNLLDRYSANELYGDEAIVDVSYINKKDVPFTVEELCQYDEFVLSNLDIRTINNYETLVSSLDTLVSEFGKSLITIGNTYIQNNEDNESLQQLSDMLPVKFGSEEHGTKLVTLLIDISRSMEEIDRLKMAKASACSILDNLEDDVNVAVVAFFGEVGTVFQPTPAKNREVIKNKINNLEAYQGTFMGAALAYTAELVASLPFDKKEVILISDGLPYREQAATSKNVVNEMAKIGISLSTIQTISNNVDAINLMKDLAKLGRGYYYYIKDLKDVESLILNEVLNSLNEIILEANESTVNVLLSNNTLMNGLETLPNVKGLYNNKEKSNSQVILSATYTDLAGISYDVPLYTYWNYGNGKVSTFSSKLIEKWTEYWLENEEATEVLKNIVKFNQPSERLDSAFIISTETKGTITTLTVDAPTLNKNSIVTINMKCPNGEIIVKDLLFDSQNFTTNIVTDQSGTYEVHLSYMLGAKEYSTDYTIEIAYLPEYNSFMYYEASNLYYMISQNGQLSLDGNLSLENNNSIIQKYIVDFTPLFMLISVILFVIDVLIRKLRWQDIKSLFKFLKKNKYYQKKGE